MHQLQFYTCVLRLQQANHLTVRKSWNEAILPHHCSWSYTPHEDFRYYFVNSHREVQANLLQLLL